MNKRTSKNCSFGKVDGFTLLEVMIVVAIVAILASIAYASYQGQITKSRRAAGAGCLQERAQFMERYYTTYLTYNDTTTPPEIQECDTEVSPHYKVDLVPDSAGTKTFILEAVPQDRQATNDKLCGTLTINAQGVRAQSGGTATDAKECW